MSFRCSPYTLLPVQGVLPAAKTCGHPALAILAIASALEAPEMEVVIALECDTIFTKLGAPLANGALPYVLLECFLLHGFCRTVHPTKTASRLTNSGTRNEDSFRGDESGSLSIERSQLLYLVMMKRNITETPA